MSIISTNKGMEFVMTEETSLNAVFNNSDSTDFTITSSNRSKIGFKGIENEILVIPETFVDPDDGKLYRVVKIDEYAFQDCVLTSITIPESVTNAVKWLR